MFKRNIHENNLKIYNNNLPSLEKLLSEDEVLLFRVKNYQLSINDSTKSSYKDVFISNKNNLVIYDEREYFKESKFYILNIKSINYDNIHHSYSFNFSLNRNIDISFYINSEDLNLMYLYSDLQNIKFVNFINNKNFENNLSVSFYDNLLNGQGDLESFLNIEYNKLNEFLGVEIGFGECLAIEVIIVLIYLRKFEALGFSEFCSEIENVFKLYSIGLTRAIELSDAFEVIINKWKFFSYMEFSATYRLFKEKYKWIKLHKISKNSHVYRLILFSKIKKQEELYEYLKNYYGFVVKDDNFEKLNLDLKVIVNNIEFNKNISLLEFYKRKTNLFLYSNEEVINSLNSYELIN